MSTIKTNTLQNVAGSKSVPVDTVVDGSAKAWANFNGTGTVAIRAAFNVSSITDNGVGDYTANFTSALPDTNFAPQCSRSNVGTSVNSLIQFTVLATTSARVQNFENNVLADIAGIYLAFFR